MATRRKTARTRNKLLGKEDARAKAAANDIGRWLGAYGDDLIREAIADLRGMPRKVTKTVLTERQKQILEILKRHGLRQMRDAGREHKRDYEIPNRRVEAFIREKTILVVGLDKKIREEFRISLAQAMSNWMAEKPTPSMGAIARRIRANFFVKPEGKRDEGLKSIPGGIGLVRTVHGRAELIARTEIGNARAKGHMEGMKAAGIKWKKWVAETKDRKSGDRRHWEMNGVIIPIDDDFVMPRIKGKGQDRMKSPKIGPIHQIANCRCHAVAVRGPKGK